ncbi:MAG: polysaccharide biosynthesis tyrosine autokinase [Chloroherpetonaceae bacterium]|nr:polysaccharide biosynthesis tyrosine autokinase [Chloroherpetonaceae bacterium]
MEDTRNGSRPNTPNGASRNGAPFRPQQNEESEDVSIQELLFTYWRAVNRGKWIILIIFILSISASIYLSSLQPDIYESNTTVMMFNQRSSASVVVSLGMTAERETQTANEIFLLESRTVLEEVAYRLVNTLYQNPQLKRDTLKIIQSPLGGIDRIDAIAGKIRGGMTISAVIGTNALSIAFRAVDPYEAATVSRAIAETYIERSRNSRNNAARVLRLFIEDQMRLKKDDLARKEQELQSFMEENHLVSIDAEAEKLIARQSEALAKIDEANIVYSGLAASLEAYNREIEELQEKLPTTVIQATLDPYTKSFQSEIARLEFERDQILAIPNTRDNPNTKSQLDGMESQIVAYRSKLEEAVRKQLQQGSTRNLGQEYLNSLIGKKIETELQMVSIETRLKALKALAESYDKAFLKTPIKSIEYTRLKRNYNIVEDLYTLLMKRYQEALIAEEQVPSTAEVVDAAVPNFWPVAPNRSKNIFIGAFLAFALSVGFVVLLQFLDRAVYTPEQAELMGTLIGTVPVISTFDETVRTRSDAKKAQDILDLERKVAPQLITHFDPKSTVSEAYRSLRTNLLFSGSAFQIDIQGKGKAYIVTSSSPKEGKSTTISNLAITIAQGGQKVLLVDTDLRRPVLHNIFGFNKEPGLTNYLVGRTSLDDIIRPSLVQNLDVITSGTIPPNPSELLAMSRMRDFLEQMRERYEIILFDTPPIIAVTDAQVLTKITDGVVLIISSGTTQADLAKRSRDAVLKVNGNLLGFVLNNFDVTNTYGSYYRYYRYYNYYYDPKNTKQLQKTLLDRIAEKLFLTENKSL